MSRLRTFLAVELDRGVRARLLAMQRGLARSVEEVRWVEEDNLHLTLLFLGEVEERELAEVCRVVGVACRQIEPFNLTVEGVGCFPNLQRPRVVWAGISTGKEELITLHDVLEAPLLELGCYRREERQYTPHVTLGRVKSDRPVDRLARAIGKHQHWQGGESEVSEVLVMSSQLTPQGPIYSVMSTAPLGQK
jgi:2'-5' RNA ligase